HTHTHTHTHTDTDTDTNTDTVMDDFKQCRDPVSSFSGEQIHVAKVGGMCVMSSECDVPDSVVLSLLFMVRVALYLHSAGRAHTRTGCSLSWHTETHTHTHTDWTCDILYTHTHRLDL